MWRYDQDGSIGRLPLGKGVVHVAIATCEDVAETKLCEGMTVFWRGDRPIGHVLVHEGETTNCKVGHIDETFLAAIDVDMQTRAEIKLSASVVICSATGRTNSAFAFRRCLGKVIHRERSLWSTTHPAISEREMLR